MERLRDFHEWLEKGRTRATFTTPQKLETAIVLALNRWLAQHPEYQRVEKAAAADDPRLYLEWLREQTATIDIRGLGATGSGKAHNFPIEDLYIPLTTPSERLDERQPLELEEALQHRRLVIVGDPGSGKTTFLRRITYALTSEALAKSGGLALLKPAKPLFPILIRVAELAEHIERSRKKTGEPAEAPGWLGHFLASRNATYGWGLSETFFAHQLMDGAAMVLLDGLDEAPDRTERQQAARLFENAT
jgi:predicted NACHT family NTPase